MKESLPGCKGIWTVYHKSLRSDSSKGAADEDEYHAYLIISLENRTMVLQTANNLEEEVADNNYVYRNEIHHPAAECSQVLQDVVADPTLLRTKSVRCANCGHGEVIFFQAFTNER